MPNLWYSPACDIVLQRVKAWIDNYERGEVESTCKFHDTVYGLIDKPTRYAHRIPWNAREFDYMLAILKEYCPNKPLIEELQIIAKEKLPNGKMLSGGYRLVTMAFYPEHVQQVYDALLTARDGKKQTLAEQIDNEGLF